MLTSRLDDGSLILGMVHPEGPHAGSRHQLRPARGSVEDAARRNRRRPGPTAAHGPSDSGAGHGRTRRAGTGPSRLFRPKRKRALWPNSSTGITAIRSTNRSPCWTKDPARSRQDPVGSRRGGRLAETSRTGRSPNQCRQEYSRLRFQMDVAGTRDRRSAQVRCLTGCRRLGQPAVTPHVRVAPGHSRLAS